MKFFSISFLPERKDVNKKAILISILFGDEKSKKLTGLLFMCIFIFIGFILNQYELIYYAFLSFIAVPKITDIIMTFSQIKKNDKSYMAKRPVIIDFYGDHIVYNFTSTERFKGNFEKHYPFSDVTSVIDSKKSIAFSFNEKDSVIIPKRAMTEQDNQMINNLIENLFKSKLIRVDI